MKYNKKIPIEDTTIKTIIKSIENGENEYYEVFSENPTVTQNGKGAAIWNYINTFLKENLDSPRYKVDIIRRGIWSLIYLYDKKTKYLYTFMRHNNYNSICKDEPSKHIMHYVNLLSKLNDELLGTYEPEFLQLSFINEVEVDGVPDKNLEWAFKEIISSVGEEIERYAIVLFDVKKIHIQRIECVIPTKSMGRMYTEDWSQYIQVEYDGMEFALDDVGKNQNLLEIDNNQNDIDLSIINDKLNKKNKAQ